MSLQDVDPDRGAVEAEVLLEGGCEGCACCQSVEGGGRGRGGGGDGGEGEEGEVDVSVGEGVNCCCVCSGGLGGDFCCCWRR